MAAPVGVTQALPGLDAGAVHAAGVGDTLVAVLALPAIQTPARHMRANTQSHAVSLTGGTEHGNQAKHKTHGELAKITANTDNPCGI